MVRNPHEARSAAQDEIRKILFAPPDTEWRVHEGGIDGVSFTLLSSFELGAVDRAFSGALRRAGTATTGSVTRRSRIWAGGGFLRTDSPSRDAKAPATCTLEHGELGGIYVDLTDRTYLHFSPRQLPGKLPDAARRMQPDWAVTTSKGAVLLSARGPVALDVEIAVAGEAPPATVRAVIAACLPDVARLGTIGLPLAALEEAGMPRAITVWQVDRHGKRAGRLATHELAEIETGPIPPDTFRIPEGFRNLRRRRDAAAKFHPIHRGKYQPMRPRQPATQPAARARAMAAAPAMMQFAPFGSVDLPSRPAVEPELPSCLPSTLKASCAYEIQQSLVDTVGYFLDLIAQRMDTVAGAHVGDRSDVKLTIDWLNQVQRFSDRTPQGDGLFCLLREAPPADDPTGGGNGLLDRLAVTMATNLLAASNPLPLGGTADPIALLPDVTDDITQVAGDHSIAPEDRFKNLTPDSRAAVREAVLAKRIAIVDYTFNGSFGTSAWPDKNFDLVWVRQRLDRIAITFSDLSMVQKLQITVDDDGLPHIDFKLSVAHIDATIHMERWPGLWFWLLAPETLLAAGIIVGVAAAAVAGAIIATLMGLGPLGLLILMGMLEAAPLAAIGEIAGGLLLLAAVTYLVWDVTDVHLQIADAVLTSSVAPALAINPEEIVLEADAAKLDGTITVSVNSEIPSGIHQLFDWIVNLAIGGFDRQVRDQIETALRNGITGALRTLPHFCLPLPVRINAKVPANLPDAPGNAGPATTTLTVAAPIHRMENMGANGVADDMLSEASLTTMRFPFPGLGPFLTQVDPDSRDRLNQVIEAALANGGAPLFGYAVSQNLLNGVVFARWLAQQYSIDYGAKDVSDAFAVLVAACPDCDALTDRAVHVWAAAPPQVQVTARAFDQDARHPYLSVALPDVRLCIGGTAGKPSSLEVEFSVTATAHVAFGTESSTGKDWSLFSVDRNFLHVLFDERPGFHSVSNSATQGLATSGPGFATIAAMDAAARLQFLHAILPVLQTAAVRLLHQENATLMVFDGAADAVNRQIYDTMFAIDLVPHRASIYAICSVTGPAVQVMPTRKADGTVAGLFDTMNCADGQFLLNQF